MTDFQFLSSDGAVNVTFRTDFIGAPSEIQGGENLTIHEIYNNSADGSVDDADVLFANWQKVKYTVKDIKDFATTNNLKLIALQISKPDAGSSVLQIEVLAAPTGFDGTVNSATQITLNWTKTPRATGYSIQRATNSGFTTGVVNTTVGDVAVLVVTGLTTATQYWFKIKATAPNATDSAYTASINKTTS